MLLSKYRLLYTFFFFVLDWRIWNKKKIFTCELPFLEQCIHKSRKVIQNISFLDYLYQNYKFGITQVFCFVIQIWYSKNDFYIVLEMKKLYWIQYFKTNLITMLITAYMQWEFTKWSFEYYTIMQFWLSIKPFLSKEAKGFKQTMRIFNIKPQLNILVVSMSF